jgi:hypothetical protein
VPSFPRTPFLHSGVLPPQPKCQHRYAPMVFGFIPECRSASLRNERSTSSESPVEDIGAELPGFDLMA